MAAAVKFEVVTEFKVQNIATLLSNMKQLESSSGNIVGFYKQLQNTKLFDITNLASAALAFQKISARIDESYHKMAKLNAAMGGMGNHGGKKERVNPFAGVAQVVGGVSSAFGGLIGHTAKWVGLLIGGAGALGVASAMRHIKDGVESIVPGFESVETTIAGIYQRVGYFGKDNKEALAHARNFIQQISEDSAALPGDLSDFLTVAELIAPELARSGIGMDKLRGLTSATAVNANLIGINMAMAGREMGALLRGEVISKNRMASLIGLVDKGKMFETDRGSKGWKELTVLERYNQMMKELQGSMNMFTDELAMSWETLTSTAIMHGRSMLNRLTLPLSDSIRFDLQKWIKWYEANSIKILSTMTTWGESLAKVYAKISRLLDRIPLQKIWTNLKKDLAEIRTDFSPIIDAFHYLIGLTVKWGESFVEHPIKAVTQLLTKIAALYIGFRSVAALMPLLANPATLGSMGAVLSGGALAAGGAGAAIVGGAAVLAVAGGAAGVADSVATNPEDRSPLQALVADEWRALGELLTMSGGLLKDTLGSLYEALKPILHILGSVLLFALMGLVGVFDILLGAVRLVAIALNGLWDIIHWIGEKLGLVAASADQSNAINRGTTADHNNSPLVAKGAKTIAEINADLALKEARDRQDIKNKKAGEDKPDFKGGGTHIDGGGFKVEIRVDTKNDDPDRVVRRIYDGIGKAISSQTSTLVPFPG